MLKLGSRLDLLTCDMGRAEDERALQWLYINERNLMRYLPEFVPYAGQLEHVTEVVNQLQCAGDTGDQVLIYLARKYRLNVPLPEVK